MEAKQIFLCFHPRIIDGIVCWDGIEIHGTKNKWKPIYITSKTDEESENKYRIATDAKDGILWNLVTNGNSLLKKIRKFRYEIDDHIAIYPSPIGNLGFIQKTKYVLKALKKSSKKRC
jgi:hypothetical protein